MNARIKFFYVGCWAGVVVTAIGGGVVTGVLGSIDRDLAEIAQVVAMLPAVALMIGWFACALWWLHDAWDSVPEGYREAPMIGPISPTTAVALFFVPCFNVFWIFMCNIGLAESINRALAAQGSAHRAPTGVAIAACCFHLVPYCNLLFGPPIWFYWMLKADEARAELGKIDATAYAQVF